MKKRLVGLIICAVLLVSSASVGFAAGEDNISFVDANLKQALKDIGADTSGDTEISQDEMAALSGSLDISGKGIADLDGLQFATGITGLDISGNAVHDIGAISGLTLTDLNVTDNYLDIRAGSGDMADIETLQTAGCTVMYSPQNDVDVTGVSVQSEVSLCFGDTVTLSATIDPIDATNQNVSWSSSDEEVAAVAGGVVSAVDLGSAIITVTTQDGGFAAQCIVNVVPAKITSDLYAIWEGKLWFASEKTSVEALCDNLTNDNAYLSVHNKDGSEYSGEAVGTKMSVRLTVGGEIKDEVTILTRGDGNGDGVISITDYTMARLHILDLSTMGEPDWFAIDLSGDGIVTITDYTMLRIHILELTSIPDSYSPIDPDESVDPTNPNDPGYLATISNPRLRYFIEIALAQQGKPYVGGDEGPDSYDCSGLIYYCLRQAGEYVYRATAVNYSGFFRIADDAYDWDWIEDLDTVNQTPGVWRWPWTYVAAEDMQPGDLMFYEKDTENVSDYENKPIGHVGIYLGNGYHIHASSTYGQVIISRFEGWYEEWFRYARRVDWD